MKNGDSINWQGGAKANPFKVPDNYFEDFQSRMLDSIREEEKKEVRSIINLPITRWLSGAAAILLLGFIGFQQLYINPHNDLRAEEAMYSVVEFFAMDVDDWTMTEIMADNELIELDAVDGQAEFLEWMDIDEYTIIEAAMDGAY